MYRKAAALAIAIALTAATAGSQQGNQQSAVFRRVMVGSSAPETSANLPNIGQAMHLLTIMFPSADAPVSGIQVRIEASYDNTTFFPISPDITTAPRLAGLTYQIEKAYAPYPFLRIRSLTSPPLPMTVWYSGQRRPITNYIAEEQDRFIL